MAKINEFKLVSNFTGYVTKKDRTNTSIRNLVTGSQNVLINDGEKVESRLGFELLGAANASGNPIRSSFVWNTSTGTELPLRLFDDELEAFLGTIDGVTVDAWTRIRDGFSVTSLIQFTTFWDTTEALDELLFVDGTSNIFEWSGGVTSVASSTTTTITKNTTDNATWAESRFLIGGIRQVTIGGTVFTYTGGEGTDTLTGVTPDASGIAANAIAIQTVRVNANSAITGLPNAFANDLISELNNQIYVGSLVSREVFISKNTTFLDFSFASPRVPGEGALLTLSNVAVGFVPQEQQMYITAGKDDWYQTSFTLSSDNLAEALNIQRLKTAPRQAAQEQDLIAKIKNDVVIVTNEPTLDSLGRIVEVTVTPQQKSISDPIKPDFDAEDFTNGDVQFFRNRLYIASPVNSKLYTYDLQKGYWFPPHILPIRKLAIIGGELHFHSNTTAETYKLFVGNTDNDNPIDFRAKFAYRNYGDRSSLKNFDEYFSELYLTPNTKLTLRLDYDFQGSSGTQEFTLDGSDETFRFASPDDASLGKKGLGQAGLGSSPVALDDMPKFRQIVTMRATDFYEIQTTYETTVDGAAFQILAHGAAVRSAPSGNFAIKT